MVYSAKNWDNYNVHAICIKWSTKGALFNNVAKALYFTIYLPVQKLQDRGQFFSAHGLYFVHMSSA